MLRPLGDRIIVKALDQESKSPGGILLPDTAQQRPMKGEVIAVGEGKLLDNGERVPMEVKPGDRVIFSKYGGTEIKEGDEEYVILRHDDIHAVLSG